jgi:hypothetical protein
VGRALFPLAMTGVQVAAAVLVLGRPDLPKAGALLTGQVPTVAGEIAVVQVLLWLLTLGAFAAAIGAALRDTRSLVLDQRARRAWGVAMVVAGACILVAGGAHRLSAPTVQLSGGGSLQEANQTLGR